MRGPWSSFSSRQRPIISFPIYLTETLPFPSRVQRSGQQVGKGATSLPGLPHSLPQFPRPESTARAPARPPRLTWSPRRRRRLGSSIAKCPCMRPRPWPRPSPPGPPPNTIGSVGQLTPGGSAPRVLSVSQLRETFFSSSQSETPRLEAEAT